MVGDPVKRKKMIWNNYVVPNNKRLPILIAKLKVKKDAFYRNKVIFRL